MAELRDRALVYLLAHSGARSAAVLLAGFNEDANGMKPCEYCATQHYEEFVVRELLNRALTDLGESGELADRLSTEQ